MAGGSNTAAGAPVVVTEERGATGDSGTNGVKWSADHTAASTLEAAA